MRTVIALTMTFLWMVPATQAATGSAETGDVTVDTRSTNADLSALSLSSGTLAPAFDAATTSYTAGVANATTSLTVTPTRAEANASIEVRINGGSYTSVTSGSPSGSLALNVGANPIDLRVTAQAGNTKTYTVTVTRAKASQTITFASPGTRFISEVLTLAATGGGSSSGVTYEVLSGPGAIANGNELSFTGGGSVTLRASQAGDDFHDDATPVEQTFEVILPKPDVAVGLSPSALIGVEVYAPSGQLVTLISKKARPVTGYVGLGNRVVLPDDRAADAVVVRGSGGNALFAVSYLGNEGNVTAGILTGTYETAAIDGEDGSVLLRTVVTPNKKKLTKKKGKRKIILKKTFSSLFQVNSKAWPDATDAATIGVQTK